jgi:hypothetical protein
VSRRPDCLAPLLVGLGAHLVPWPADEVHKVPDADINLPKTIRAPSCLAGTWPAGVERELPLAGPVRYTVSVRSVGRGHKPIALQKEGAEP